MSLYELGYCDPEKDMKDFLDDYCSTRRCGAKSSIECFDPIGTRTHRYPVSCEICVRWGVYKVNPALRYVYIFDGDKTYYYTRWVCLSHFDFIVSDFENKIESFHPAGPCPQCGKPRVRIPRKQRYYQCCKENEHKIHKIKPKKNKARIRTSRRYINNKPQYHCYRCDLYLPANRFYKDKSRITGYGAACKKCRIELSREYRKKDTKVKKTYQPIYVGDKVRCYKCLKFLHVTSFHRDKYRENGRAAKCKTCVNAHSKAYYYKQKEIKKDAVG